MTDSPIALTGPFADAPFFAVNGEGFDAALRTHRRRMYKPPLPVAVQTIPVRGAACQYIGECAKLPSDYEITAVIPCIDSSDRLPLVIELLRHQTVRPFIFLIDTGSKPEERAKIEALRAEDVEVHLLRLNGVSNSSEPVSMAMDTAVALCRTRFMFCTHDDCFLRSRTALQYFRDVAALAKIAGHELTPRPHNDWRGMVGHTALMFDVNWFVDAGLSWNMRRCMRLFGFPDATPDDRRPNWPDTEIGLNYLLRRMGVKPFLTGTEQNWKRNRDGLIDHCRSYASAAIYRPDYLTEKAGAWLEAAMREGWERVREWGTDPLPPAPPLPTAAPAKRMKIPKFTMGNY